MRALVLICAHVAMQAATTCADESELETRSITEADSVLSVYREDWGRRSSGTPAIILAAWPDGFVVWSQDQQRGGPPYRAGHAEADKIKQLLTRFENDGLFADERLNQAHFGPDSKFLTVFIKSGTQHVKMQSWHELYESEKAVVTNAGVAGLNVRRRLDVLSKEPADYLFFRFIWSDTRCKLLELMPSESRTSTGGPLMQAGNLSWQEPASDK